MSLRFTKNFGSILSQAYGGMIENGTQYNILRGSPEWLANQNIDSSVTVDNTVPDEETGFNFVRTIEGNYMPLLHLNTTNPEGWDGAASLSASGMIPFNMQSAGETCFPSNNYGDIYGIMFGDGAFTITDAFNAYNLDSPKDCSTILPSTTDITTFAPINQIRYDSATDTYTQELKWNIYNHGNSDFTFSEVGIFTTLCGRYDRWTYSELWKDTNGTWRVSSSVSNNARPVCMIAYEAFDNPITLHSGDILQIILTQGASGLDWTIIPQQYDEGQTGAVSEPKQTQTETPTQEEITEETATITDATARAVVALAETYIGNAVYTQNKDPAKGATRNGDISGGKAHYDCSSFVFDMWRRNGVTLADNWRVGTNMANTESLVDFAINHNLLVSKSQIQPGDIIVTAYRENDGSWRYDGKHIIPGSNPVKYYPRKTHFVNHAKLYVGNLAREGYDYNVIEMWGTSHDAIRNKYNLNDANRICAFIIRPTLL